MGYICPKEGGAQTVSGGRFLDLGQLIPCQPLGWKGAEHQRAGAKCVHVKEEQQGSNSHMARQGRA